MKTHFLHSDMFGGAEGEYIKSFVLRRYAIGFHTHSFYELNIIMGGEGTHYIGNMSCEARPGSVFLIPPHIQHAYDDRGGLDVYHMLIHRDFISACFSEFQQTAGFSLLFETEPYLRAHYKESMFLELTEGELSMLRQDIVLIDSCKTLSNADIFINAVAKKLLCQLCVLISGRQGVGGIAPQSKKELGAIADCLNYIHQNYDEKLTIAHLAERLSMSRSTFIRQFERICGCSPHQYICRYRLEKARKQLTAPGASFTAVAQECGFYDASHLRKYLDEKQTDS